MIGFDERSRRGGSRQWWVGLVRGWLGRFGSVTHLIVWVTVALFLLQLVAGLIAPGAVEWLLALQGGRFVRGFLWQPVTYMFLHDTYNLWHILINLLVLWFIGREVEYFIGPNYFARLYLWCGLSGAALWLLVNFQSWTYLLGASAAVLGCVIAFATLFPDREITFLVFFILPVRLKARYLSLILIAFDALPLLAGAQTNVAHLAHLGGAAMGYLYIKHLGYGITPRWLQWWQWFVARLKPRRRTPRVKTPEDFMREDVDPILDKISREGIHSLTRRERKILEAARDYMRQTPR